MTSNTAANTNQESERTLGQSVLYWLGVYAIVIPITSVIIGLIVYTTLTFAG